MQLDARLPAIALDRGGNAVMRQHVAGEGQHAGKGQLQVAHRHGGCDVAAARRSRGTLLRRFETLTTREREIVRQLARGFSNATLAQELELSEATVKTHVNRVLTKLSVTSRVQAVVLAYESGFVKPGHTEGIDL